MFVLFVVLLLLRKEVLLAALPIRENKLRLDSGVSGFFFRVVFVLSEVAEGKDLFLLSTFSSSAF